MKHEHKDRLYQHNLVEKGLDPNAYYYAEVDEDEGGYGAFCFMLRAWDGAACYAAGCDFEGGC
jgi:hypothetical protein